MTIKELVQTIPKSTIINICHVDGTEYGEYFYWKCVQEDDAHCFLVLVNLKNYNIIYRLVWFDNRNNINGISVLREVDDKEHDQIIQKIGELEQ